MKKLNICILGGSGFVGHSVAAELVKTGHNVKVLCRKRKKNRDILVLPGSRVVEADPGNLGHLFTEFQGQDVIINLIGILHSGRKHRAFWRTHVQIPELIINACEQTGVKRVLHVGALHASVGGDSAYLRSKGEGELKILKGEEKGIHVTVFRPSVIFGPEDKFLNRFRDLLAAIPLPFPLACPNTKFQPVYVEDLARVMAASLQDYHTYGQRYNVCGPQTYSLRELVEYVMKLAGLKRRIIGLGPFMSRLQARILGIMPGKPFTMDNYRSMQIDSTCKESFEEQFGFAPTPLEHVAPLYLLPRTDPDDTRRRNYIAE